MIKGITERPQQLKLHCSSTISQPCNLSQLKKHLVEWSINVAVWKSRGQQQDQLEQSMTHVVRHKEDPSLKLEHLPQEKNPGQGQLVTLGLQKSIPKNPLHRNLQI